MNEVTKTVKELLKQREALAFRMIEANRIDREECQEEIDWIEDQIENLSGRSISEIEQQLYKGDN